ncbi:TetR/AcrR family transcriptional regulator [Amycolatopsis viridis]|uniref:AcrR family transcriptional regulator n=1 Tax=Amycolatopsis viridis TaxID=185678 RepID=A0ABX0SSZ4_9PSEU|nr:TetR/AcrR family transcriptional regulator [Amycolatopsis viridis]NIH79599.1 AcrR family transcriptional regulator [Amycolatopsis viridis]
MERGRAPGQRAGLTRATVLRAARDLLAERGLPGLSMRALAARLDVAPNALYSHVANKTALLDELLDDVLAEVAVPPDDVADPAAGLHALLASTYTVLLAHPGLVPLYLSRQGAHGPHAHRLGEVTAALLRRAHVAEPAVPEALRVLIVYTIGFAAFASHLPEGTGTERRPGTAQMRDNFRQGLDWLVSGIRQTAGERP